MKCPYACTNEDFLVYDCPSDPSAVPANGDVGMCYHCGGWWTMVDGHLVEYTPSDEQMQVAYSTIRAYGHQKNRFMAKLRRSLNEISKQKN